MAWTAPRTWVTGEVVTAAIGNTHWRDNLRYLKGLDGAVTIEDALTVDSLVTSGNVDGVDVSTHAGGDAFVQHGNNIGNHTHQTSGAQGNKLDHGAALDGLGDADHSAYQAITLLTTRGDIIYRNATVWARLAKGSSGQVLTMDANDPTWGTAGATLTVSETEVFNGNSPGASAWTDLDLSGTVGSQVTLVLLKITGDAGGAFAVRKNGDTDEFFSGTMDVNAAGVALIRPFGTTVHEAVWVATDSAGKIEWKYEIATDPVTIDIIAYIK